MRYAACLMATLLLAVQAVGCAGTRASGNVYETDLGRTTAQALFEHVPKVFDRYTFDVLRAEERGEMGLYYETEWKVREPMEDEAALGYQEARTRILIEARRSGVPLGDIPLFRVRFTAENRLRKTSSDPWEELPLTEMFREYMGRIVLDIRREVGTVLH